MDETININRNNLDRSNSPYLKQHAGNPVNWQEWSAGVLAIAREQKKKILVSIGYSTCHWCHVMASGAFSDTGIARYLNDNFISIKVDREQRPDIDQYFMSFITAATGSGGWPLNVFLSPEADPIIAFTYIPVERRQGMPSMMDVLAAVEESGEGISFELPHNTAYNHGGSFEALINNLIAEHDDQNGGFGSGHKFPPSCTMLLLISYYERYRDDNIKNVIETTLDAMTERGLHDHLQGGFFRYCVDSGWTIPHFEKMLYDQAMLLWVYSWAFIALKNSRYIEAIKGLLKCLEDTFLHNGLYISAHDADTLHVEGATYTWELDELNRSLEPDELTYMKDNYFLTGDGNFEGANHLIRKKPGSRSHVEAKLLGIRNKRAQPFADRKIITSWNAFTGIGLVMAWRALGDYTLLERAECLMNRLIEEHVTDDVLAHSSLDGVVQHNEFLEDAASLLLFATYIHEEKKDRKELIQSLVKRVCRFYDSEWFESDNNDFKRVMASEFDHPVPSSLSTVTMALLRSSILTNEEYKIPDGRNGAWHEFYNLAIFIAEGHWHIIHAPEKISWQKLPLNSIQVQDETFSDCFDGACRTNRDV